MLKSQIAHNNSQTWNFFVGTVQADFVSIFFDHSRLVSSAAIIALIDLLPSVEDVESILLDSSPSVAPLKLLRLDFLSTLNVKCRFSVDAKLDAVAAAAAAVVVFFFDSNKPEIFLVASFVNEIFVWIVVGESDEVDFFCIRFSSPSGVDISIFGTFFCRFFAENVKRKDVVKRAVLC